MHQRMGKGPSQETRERRQIFYIENGRSNIPLMESISDPGCRRSRRVRRRIEGDHCVSTSAVAEPHQARDPEMEIDSGHKRGTFMVR